MQAVIKSTERLAMQERQACNPDQPLTTPLRPPINSRHRFIVMPRLSNFQLTIAIPKAANDNGFDRQLKDDGEWLVFTSSRFETRLWIRPTDTEQILVAVAPGDVLSLQASFLDGAPYASPTDAEAQVIVADLDALYRCLNEIYARSLSLKLEASQASPAPVDLFRARTRSLPQTTEAERLVVERIGQDIFRSALLRDWGGMCAVTGLDIPALLRASHIKPWAACDTTEERLDPYNGFLLAPHLDLAFDQGFITFTNAGALRPSSLLSKAQMTQLGIHPSMRLRRIDERHLPYLDWHTREVFLR